METPKRLQPLAETLRPLYSLSGNQCAFPGCNHPMFNNDGNFVGQICHIEAALPGGERFNPNMTNESRRSFENLMLMCYDHHIETDKVHMYPVWKMQEIKRQHEEIYSNIERFIHQMQSSLTDVTSSISVPTIQSLTNLYIELYDVDDREPEHIEEDVNAFNLAISKLSAFSPDAKQLFALSLSRAQYEQGTYGPNTENIFVDPYEIERITQANRNHLFQVFQEIERAGFLSLDQEYNGQSVFWICLQGTEANLWEMIRQFCNKRSLDIKSMVANLNFAAID